MKDKEFLEGLCGVVELAKEVHIYAKTAWPIVGHRSRSFGVSNKARLRNNEGEDLWLNIWTVSWSSHEPSLSVKYSKGRYWSAPGGFDAPPSYSGAGIDIFKNRAGTIYNIPPSIPEYVPEYVTEAERDLVLRDFKEGFAKLFEYIQAECKRGFAECWGSVDAEYRWKVYDQEFVERVNKKRLLQYLEAVLKGISDTGLALRKQYGNHPDLVTLSLVSMLENPAWRALELAERVKEATKQRKLFVE